MAIVHMTERVDRFLNQLEITDEKIFPDPQYFDYDEGKEVYRFDEEINITLPDFTIEFGLEVVQTGTYDPGDGYCQPPEFIEDTTTVEVLALEVYDNVYGEFLRLNREEFTEVINLVRDIIKI